MRQSRFGRVLSITVLLVTSVLLPAALNRPGDSVSALQAQPSVLEYWALGDSIAAGTGLGDDGMGTDATPCQRSWDRAYPQRLAGELASHYGEVHFPPENFLACSGAHVLWAAPEEVSKCQLNFPGNPDCENKWLQNQVTTVVEYLEAQRQAGRSPHTLVTITAGANDLQYTDPLTVYQAITWDDNWFELYLKQHGDAVFWGLLGQISRLVAYENVSVVVTDIHNPFNRDSFLFHLSGSRCNVATAGTLSSPAIDCYRRTARAVQAVNGAIWLAAGLQLKPGQVQMATIHDLFQRHESPTAVTPGITPCGYAPPSVANTWIQYATDPNSNSYPFVSNSLAQLLIPGAAQWSGDCVHPNDEGAQQYANAVIDVALTLLE